jgi:hypothetical protein
MEANVEYVGPKVTYDQVNFFRNHLKTRTNELRTEKPGQVGEAEARFLKFDFQRKIVETRKKQQKLMMRGDQA